jgi:ABC-type dipeptide/oligopeptide/nickel transport system permease component
LKNGLIPVVTILGLQLGVLLAGAIITEKIFNWQGWVCCCSTTASANAITAWCKAAFSLFR